MRVDSFAFLPRSFRPLFEKPPRLPGHEAPVWAPFEKRLAEAKVALLTSAGLYLKATQPSFDGEREKREPTWGDPTWRAIPAGVTTAQLGMMHLHLNSADVLADHDIALPTTVLAELVREGVVGAASDRHISVMGFQQAGLEAWRGTTAPEIAAALREEGADGVVLAPS
jgi:D-proline reductase (dithiol) PrdB